MAVAVGVGRAAQLQWAHMQTESASDAVPRKPGRPPKATSDAAAAIRKAALQAFARAGFNGASIVEIARTAGVAKPLVHYHYASKDLLWEAAVGEAVAVLQAQIGQFQGALAASASPPGLLRMVAHQLVVFAASHPALVHIVVDETGKGGPRAQWLQHHLLQPGYAGSGPRRRAGCVCAR